MEPFLLRSRDRAVMRGVPEIRTIVKGEKTTVGEVVHQEDLFGV